MAVEQKTRITTKQTCSHVCQGALVFVLILEERTQEKR